jgi:SAM-dependent methyltransferase
MDKILNHSDVKQLKKWLSNPQWIQSDPFKRSALLKKEKIPTEIIPLLSSILDLQIKAKEKLGVDRPLLVDRLALEQASAKWISDYKNSLLPKSSKIVDLCCGLGGDSLHLNDFQSLIGIDLSLARLEMFKFNLDHKDSIQCIRGNALYPIINKKLDFLLCDPDRRSQENKSRNWNPDDLRPNFDELARWESSFSGCLFKLSPSLDWKSLPIKGDIDFLGKPKECNEALIRKGTLAAEEPTLRAVIKDETPLIAPWKAVLEANPTLANSLNDYLIEPSKTCIRSGINRWYAQQNSYEVIHPDIAYLTGDTPIDSPYFTSFKVVGVGSGNDKKLKQFVKQHNAQVIEVKKRGANIDPATELQKLKKVKGEIPMTLFFTQTLKGHIFVLTKRLV